MMLEVIRAVFLTPLFLFLPVFVVANIIFSSILAIKKKQWDWLKFPSFIKMATFFFVFLSMVEIIYQVFSMEYLDITVLPWVTIRTIAWGAAYLYYFINIYQALIGLGFPRIFKLEEKFNDNENGGGAVG